MTLDLQPCYFAPVLYMLFDNFVDVGFVDIRVPSTFGIDHQHRSFVAAIEAAGVVNAHATLAAEPERFHFLLGVVTQTLRAEIGATPRTGFASIGAEEQMISVVGIHVGLTVGAAL